MTAVRSILRSCSKKDKYRFVTFLTNMYYDQILSNTGHEFHYWNNKKQPDPNLPNFYPINDDDLPIHLDVDAVICQSIEQYPTCKKLSSFWHLPLIYLGNACNNNPISPKCDLYVYSSDVIANSFREIGAILPLPIDTGFSDVVRETVNRDLIITHINDPAELNFCKQVVRYNPNIRIQTVEKDRSVRFDQLSSALCFLQLHNNQYPYHAIEAAYCSVPVLSVENPMVDFVKPEHVFNSVSDCYSKIHHLNQTSIKYNVKNIDIDEYISSINNVFSFLDSFIFIK